MINDHDQWLYHKEKKPRLFLAGEEITEGWYDSPMFETAVPMWGGTVGDDAPEDPEKPLYHMNKAELLAHAEILGVEDLDESMTKNEIKKLIEMADDNG